MSQGTTTTLTDRVAELIRDVLQVEVPAPDSDLVAERADRLAGAREPHHRGRV